MKILTWNINGIRASSREIPLKTLLDSLEADIICLQETKVTREQLDEASAIVEGYNAFFSFSRVKGGYSGVATFCKTACTPKAVEEGLTGILTDESNSMPIKCYADNLTFTSQQLTSLDAEGRAILSEHEIPGCRPVVIVNLYCPRADRDNEERWNFKQNFYHLVEARCEKFLSSGKDVIILGDFNVSHKKLDHCDPDADPEYFASNESRIWMSKFLLPVDHVGSMEENSTLPASQALEKDLEKRRAEGDDLLWSCESQESVEFCNQDPENERQFVDLFRHYHPKREHAFTCWSTVTSARKTNYGTRIDYILVNKEFLLNNAVYCDIRPDIHGSDHCPVEAVFNCDIKPSAIIPDLCTALMPEFKGKQKSIKNFFKAGQNSDITEGTHLEREMGPSFNDDRIIAKEADIDTNEASKYFGTTDSRYRQNGVKRKAAKDNSKQPAKLQRKGSGSLQNLKGSRNNFLSYFQKSTTPTTGKDAKTKKEELLQFLKDAKVTDSSLQEDIMKDCIVSKSSELPNATEGRLENFTENCITGKLKVQTKGCFKAGDAIDLAQSPIKPGLSQSGSYIEKDESSSQCIEDNAPVLNPFIRNKTTKLSDQGSRKSTWKSLLKGPDPLPVCDGHKEPCVMRTVKKQGPNLGRHFYCCARPEGRANDKEARCKTFIWKKK